MRKKESVSSLSRDFLIIFTVNRRKRQKGMGKTHMERNERRLWHDEKTRRDKKRVTFVLSSRFYVDQCDGGNGR